MEEKKSGKGLVFLCCVLSLIIVAMGAFILYDKVLSPSETTDNGDTTNANSVSSANQNTTTVNESTTSSSKESQCAGKYYGEASGTISNGLSYDYKYTYTLNSDGTFIADFSGGSGSSGIYVIYNHTITFIQPTSFSVPDAINMYSQTYKIADDCSSMTTILSDGSVMNLMRQ